MYVHHPFRTGKIAAPDPFEETFTGPGHARMLCQSAEEIKFQFGEFYGFSDHGGRSSPQVDA